MRDVAATVPVQLASPDAFETRNFPRPGDHPAIVTCHVMRVLQLTWRLAVGQEIPIQKLFPTWNIVAPVKSVPAESARMS